MYTDVVVVGEFDDIPTPTFRRRTPAEPVIAPVAESLATSTIDEVPVSAPAIPAPTAIDPAHDDFTASSPDLGFAPLPPITKFSRLPIANCSYLDDALPVAPVAAPACPPSHAEEESRVGTRYIASTPMPPEHTLHEQPPSTNSALRSALSPVVCFCRIFPAQDGSLSRELVSVTFSPVILGKTSKFTLSHLFLPTHKKAPPFLTKGLTEHPASPTSTIPSIATNGIILRNIYPIARTPAKPALSTQH